MDGLSTSLIEDNVVLIYQTRTRMLDFGEDPPVVWRLCLDIQYYQYDVLLPDKIFSDASSLGITEREIVNKLVNNIFVSIETMLRIRYADYNEYVN